MITITRPEHHVPAVGRADQGDARRDLGQEAHERRADEVPQSEPRPATAAPMRIWSERMTPNSLGCAKPFVPSTKSEPATPANAAEMPKASVL